MYNNHFGELLFSSFSYFIQKYLHPSNHAFHYKANKQFFQ